MNTTASIERYPLQTKPNLSGLIQNLGSSYSGLEQAINELVDDSVSALRANTDSRSPRHIRITLEERGASVNITVEDTGVGISDIDEALRIAGTAARLTPMNEHGMGLKQAIAYVVKHGGDWSLVTRDALSRDCSTCWAVNPPHNKLDGTMEVEACSEWPGELAGTGTIVRLTCPKELFGTIETGVRGNPPFSRLAALLEESLRYTYADIIRADEASIEVVSVPISGKTECHKLKPLEPDWTDECTDIKPTVIDLGGGPVTVSGRYGLITAAEDAERHYQANLATSGAVISLNGRIISGQLFSEIWGKTRHPSGNGFVLRLDVRSDSLEALPETTAEKNGFRQGDRRLKTLYSWIRAHVALPGGKEKLEIRLFKKLEAKMRMESPKSRITRELFVFTSLGFKDRVDLFVANDDGVVCAFEGKAKNTKSADIYQLRRYWDGCVHDGINITDGVLIGSKHNDEVRALVAYINTQVGEDGRPYRFHLATWAEYGIDVSAV